MSSSLGPSDIVRVIQKHRNTKGSLPSNDWLAFIKDCGIFYQTFSHHWVACRDRIHDYEPLSDRISDDILTVAAQLEQMLQLLQLELSANNNSNHNVSPMSDNSPTETSILDMILSDKDNILAQIVGWTKSIPYNQSDQLLMLEIQFCEVLLSCKRSGQTVLSHVKVLHPLLSLLDIINTLPQGHEPSFDLQSSLLGNNKSSMCFLS